MTIPLHETHRPQDLTYIFQKHDTLLPCSPPIPTSPPYKRIRRLTPTPAKKEAPPPRRNAAWLAIRHSHSLWSLRVTLVANLVSPNSVHRIPQAAAPLVPPPHALSQWRSWGCTPHSRSSTLPQLTQFNPPDPRPQTPAPSLPSPASA